MEILKKTLPAVLAVALGACELVRAPTPLELTDEHLLLLSVLQAGSDTARVLLTRNVPGSGSSGWMADGSLEPLAGATVRMASGADTVTLAGGSAGCVSSVPYWQEPVDLTPGCYTAAVPGGIRESARYALLVTLPGGGEVRGEAVVPAAPVILAPDAGAEIVNRGPGEGGDPVVVRWGGVPEGRRVVLAVAPRDTACGVHFSSSDGWGAAETVAVTEGDSAVVRIASARCGNDFGPQRIEADLVVTAYDSAYSAYALRMLGDSRSVLLDRASVGITGAVGVFAGAAVGRRPVVVVVE